MDTIASRYAESLFDLAKEENAAKTYAELKREYLAIKTILQTAGVNLRDIDEIKE